MAIVAAVLDARESEIIAFVVDACRRRLDPDRVVLFGSRARRDHWKASDFDLCVFGTTASRAAWTELQLELDEHAPTMLALQVLDAERLGPQILSDIEKDGVVVYARA